LILFLSLNQQAQATGISDFNPISHWDCDETSGVRYDSNLTNTNDLTDNNTVLYATGLLSNACDFESSQSEYLSISDANQTGLDLSTFSLSFWYKPESTANQGFAQRGTTGGNISYSFTFEPNTLYFTTYDTGGADGGNFNKAWTQTIGNWYHFVVVRDQTGNNCDLYINGVDQTVSCTTVDTIFDSTQETRVGWGNTTYSDGLLDEFTFFSTALTGTDVTTLYNSGTPLDYQGVGEPPTSTSTATSTVNMSDTNFLLVVIIFFLTFFFLTLAFSIFNKSK